jgi:phage shock protein C
MFCTNCGVELRDGDRYCPKCGVRLHGDAGADARRPLMLDKRNKKIAGVCAGFARHFEIDVVLVRVIWLVVAFTTGFGFIAYLAAWMAIPSDYGQTAAPAAAPASAPHAA